MVANGQSLPPWVVVSLMFQQTLEYLMRHRVRQSLHLRLPVVLPPITHTKGNEEQQSQNRDAPTLKGGEEKVLLLKVGEGL